MTAVETNVVVRLLTGTIRARRRERGRSSELIGIPAIR
jgi:hypothetical protein